MSEIVRTVTKMSIHRKGESPIFGKRIDLEMVDEAGGPFFLLSSEESESPMRIELEELREAIAAAEFMLGQDGSGYE